MSDDKSWIYLIVMIVLSIIGSINKSKKKNAAPTPAPMDDEDDFPTIFFPKASPEQSPAPEEAMLKPKVAVGRVPVNEEGRSVFTNTQEMQAKEGGQPEDENRQLDLNFRDQDELKKAVIYSEIFNRKFF